MQKHRIYGWASWAGDGLRVFSQPWVGCWHKRDHYFLIGPFPERVTGACEVHFVTKRSYGKLIFFLLTGILWDSRDQGWTRSNRTSPLVPGWTLADPSCWGKLGGRDPGYAEVWEQEHFP